MATVKTKRDSDAGEEILLVRAAKAGDFAAFEKLVGRNTALVFRVSMRIMNSREDAEDVVQDAFIKAFKHLRRFEERARFSTWMTKIAVNTALMKLRSLRRVQTVSLDQETDDGFTLIDKFADWKSTPDHLHSQSESRVFLQQALDLLPHNNRAVFLLRDVEGMSIADTAEMLGLSTSNVKTRLMRARLKLREHLSPHFLRGTPAVTVALRGRGNDDLRAPAAAL